jgi:hypothetical protein
MEFPLKRDDLKPLEGVARLLAIAGTGIFYVTAFPVASFFPRQFTKLYETLADFDPGESGKTNAAAPRAAKPVAKPAAPAKKDDAGE